MRKAEHGPALPTRPSTAVAPSLKAEQPGDGACLWIKRGRMAVRTIRTEQAYLKNSIEMSVRQRCSLRLPLRGPQHGRKIEARIDHDTICIGNLKKGVRFAVEDVGEIIAAGEDPIL